MIRLLNERWLMGFFAALVIAGFYLSSSAGAALALGSALTMLLRATVVVLACLLIAVGLRGHGLREPRLLMVLLTFGLLYSFKAFYVYGIEGVVPLEQAVFAVAYFMAVCLLPAIVPHATRQFAWSDSQVVWVCFFALCAFGASISAQGAMTAFGVEQGRLSLDSMGPIQVGHFGATCCIVAMAVRRRAMLALRLALVVGGFLALGFSGTRSALVALLVCAGILAYRRNASGFLRITLVTAVVALAATVYLLSDGDDIAVISRLTRLVDASDDSGSGRLEIYAETVGEIADNPLFGGGLTFLRSGFYPHNVFLEAFFSTGLIGGFAVLIYLGFGLAAARRHFLSRRHATLLPALLFIQYSIAAMMSGAIYAWGQLWFLCALLLTSPCGDPSVDRAAGVDRDGEGGGMLRVAVP